MVSEIDEPEEADADDVFGLLSVEARRDVLADSLGGIGGGRVMSAAPTRRGLLAGSAAAALGLAAGVAPALATIAPNYPGNSEVVDAALIAQADAFRSLCARENQAWNDLDDDDRVRGGTRTHRLPRAVPSLPRRR